MVRADTHQKPARGTPHELIGPDHARLACTRARSCAMKRGISSTASTSIRPTRDASRSSIPRTGKPLCEVSAGTVRRRSTWRWPRRSAALRRAYGAAWRRANAWRRAASFATLIEANAERFALLDTLCMGKPITRHADHRHARRRRPISRSSASSSTRSTVRSRRPRRTRSTTSCASRWASSAASCRGTTRC